MTRLDLLLSWYSNRHYACRNVNNVCLVHFEYFYHVQTWRAQSCMQKLKTQNNRVTVRRLQTCNLAGKWHGVNNIVKWSPNYPLPKSSLLERQQIVIKSIYKHCLPGGMTCQSAFSILHTSSCIICQVKPHKGLKYFLHVIRQDRGIKFRKLIILRR